MGYSKNRILLETQSTLGEDRVEMREKRGRFSQSEKVGMGWRKQKTKNTRTSTNQGTSRQKWQIYAAEYYLAAKRNKALINVIAGNLGHAACQMRYTRQKRSHII